MFVGGGVRLGGGGGLVVGAEPADEAALFLGGAFVVEGDEAGEEGLLQAFGIRMGGVEAVGEGDGGDEVGPAVGFVALAPSSFLNPNSFLDFPLVDAMSF